MRKRFRTTAAIVCMAAVGAFDPFGGGFPLLDPVPEANAKVGNPVSPGSVAGVARRTSRRTTRRVVRRTTTYVAALPAGCATLIVDGATYWKCGAHYYGAYGNRYVVVVID